MKAWTLEEIGRIEYKEVEKPQIKEGEALLKVRAAGICGSDIPRIYRDGAHKMPLIPGHEFSGEVVEIGDNVENKWHGKRVGVFPLIPCHNCFPCQKGQYEMCRSYSYLGSRQDGGFAQCVAVPVSNLIELPENVSFEQAAMLEPMAVAVHAMRRTNVAEDMTVVVAGAGTIGQLLVMFLLERGVKQVLVLGNKDYQKEQMFANGLPKDFFCDIRKTDTKSWLLEKTNGNGPDVFFECVGKTENISLAIDVTMPGGQICMVGNPYSDVELKKDVYWKVLRNQLRITGTWNSSFEFGVNNKEMSSHKDISKKVKNEESDWEYVLRLLKENRIAPERLISHKLPFEQLDKGLELMRDKTEDFLKVMIVNEI